jgi:hypothetical protein
MTEFPQLAPEDLNPEQEAFWRYVVDGPRSNYIRETPRVIAGPYGP